MHVAGLVFVFCTNIQQYEIFLVRKVAAKKYAELSLLLLASVLFTSASVFMLTNVTKIT